MQGGFRSSEQGSDQVVRTQEIHIVSSNSRHQDQKQSDISLKTTALSLSR